MNIEYIGTGYFGFQIQNKKGKKEITVQEALEDALRRLFKKRIRIIYSSRTDRGVHAKSQAVNFYIDTKIPLKNIKLALNDLLPKGIIAKSIKYVPMEFHSRFSVKSKIYRYIVLNKKEDSVFLRGFSWHIRDSIDLEKINAVLGEIIGNHDFYLFAKDAKKYKSCVRYIKKISVRRRGSFIYIDIEADGFLRNMARNIVSFLVKVGIEKISLSKARNILKGKESYANNPAPPYGLYLLKVKY